MRVLDPRIKNPIYRAYDRASRNIGDGGVNGILAVATAAPVGASLFIDSIYGLATAVGTFGILNWRGYKKNTKNKARINKLVELRDSIPSDDHYLINPLIDEVYHCANDHYDYKAADADEYELVPSKRGSGFTRVLTEKSKEKAEAHKREQDILVAGYGCKYCGERMIAAQELKDECLNQAKAGLSNASVEQIRQIIEVKRESNKYAKQFGQTYTDAQRELM